MHKITVKIKHTRIDESRLFLLVIVIENFSLNAFLASGLVSPESATRIEPVIRWFRNS